MNSEEGEFFDSLLLCGAIQVVGINEKTGEFLYTITEKMKDIYPEIYNEHLNQMDLDIKALWERGFLDINILEENPSVFLTTKAFVKEETETLPDDLSEVLEQIKRAFSNNI